MVVGLGTEAILVKASSPPVAEDGIDDEPEPTLDGLLKIELETGTREPLNPRDEEL